ncbi:tail fiber assembly protein [Enterobacter hormaechei]|uniref:tail fiber assembly protein n=1 Tax=Enterobacter hormaechei TaxID=158836 RepID=UPI0007989E52|nr:tail fiber assembly protein [Enterobacter hormaechei]HDS3653022.1 tail fiber assembly protein [Enterobacter hormaechei subsp. steigerwaltii]MBW7668529.1 tail fiber assembly protein [Enterobacter hormaechei]SAI25047.1 phage tail assembly chaperone gp38 [Enterobacter hormaechei]HDS8074329.1 tail fiber assembly protein [Enterobacter hormaechei subsp. steigerwaltii]HDT2484373.1 tail fiber assembly protein [Enterobacter hormaechei subsp. steigerwaltii]
MSNFIFSPSENAFYPYSLEESYIAAGSWPVDGVEVDDAVFYEFTGEAPTGKIRITGSDGLPAWGDTPPISIEEAIAAGETKKQGLIEQANEYMNSKQWPGKAAIGRLKGDDLARYSDWLDYLDALEAVNTSRAPDIDWPIAPSQ